MTLPGGPLEICFSFDTTVSMSRYIDQVKARLQSMVQRLQADIPGIRIALCAHGDHYQRHYNNKSPYVLIKLDFTDQLAAMCDFIQKADPTEGGDWEECYEYVLKEARETLSWSVHTNKVFVLIGDARPHTTDDEDNIGNIDWEWEAGELVRKGVTLYGIYCQTPHSKREDRRFFETLANKGEGSFLQIEDFEDIFDTLMAICYREQGPTALQLYEDEVKAREKAGPSRDVNNVFTTLKKSASNASTTSNSSPPRPKTRGKAPVNKASSVKTTGKPKPCVKIPTALKAKPTALKAKAPKRNVRQVQLASKDTVMNKSIPKTVRKSHPVSVQTKLRREKVPESNFILRELPWSSWRPAFCSKCTNKNWVKRDSGVGYRAGNLFKRDRKGMAFYEFAVRAKTGSRKIIVFRCTALTQTFSSGMEGHFQSRPAKVRLNNVLNTDCVVFVRRLILGRSNVYKTVRENLELYSYLWEQGSQREFVNKNDVAI